MKEKLWKIIIFIVAGYLIFGFFYNLVTAFSQKGYHNFLETPICEPFFGCENIP